jgi:hypothetical protein
VTRLRIVAAALAASLALAGCGNSPEDEARDDGKTVGEATRVLYDATTPEDAQAAAADLRASIDDLGGDARERVREQVETQGDTLDKAVQAYQAGRTAAAQGGDVEGARNDLRNAVQQIASQADSYRSGNDSIANEAWRGFEDGFDD